MTLLSEFHGPRELRIRPMATESKGRGVFAVANIALGEVIDANCTLELDEAACAAIERTPAGDHYFCHPVDESKGLLVLGLASLCNHAETPTAETSFVMDKGIGWIIVLRASRDILPGEEITRRYACPPWFDVAV
ncbi:MAG: SET domain-containing protein-lysine N-methyltransferase [Rhodospirillales bacterium]|nr:SET domain-containing protein-lysine N-methyltransferase [Rhodospirillales bacterium]